MKLDLGSPVYFTKGSLGSGLWDSLCASLGRSLREDRR